MNQIPTAEEFANKIEISTDPNPYFTWDETINLMKAFARLHVDAALKAASEKAEAIINGDYPFRTVGIDKDSILTAYKDQIK